MTRGGCAPSAIPYDSMPGYRRSADLVGGLFRTSQLFSGTRPDLAALLRGKAVLTLLSAGEAGARVEPGRRELFYRASWFATADCSTILDAATELGAYPIEARLGPDTVIRAAQQELTIAAGAMLRWADEEG